MPFDTSQTMDLQQQDQQQEIGYMIYVHIRIYIYTVYAYARNSHANEIAIAPVRGDTRYCTRCFRMKETMFFGCNDLPTAPCPLNIVGHFEIQICV